MQDSILAAGLLSVIFVGAGPPYASEKQDDGEQKHS
jgi:hypothetical protein